VVRALKLNPEYAQKLEKKSKPAAPQQASVSSSSSTTTTTPVVGGANVRGVIYLKKSTPHHTSPSEHLT